MIFVQDDKDLVHEFVNNDGLECLIKVGSEADQNYQNYILRGERPTPAYFCASCVQLESPHPLIQTCNPPLWMVAELIALVKVERLSNNLSQC